MKTVTLNGRQAVTSNHKLNGQVGWILLIKRLVRFFDDAYESDREKKAGLSLKVSFFG
jgi:hypothetical protein